VQPPDHVHAVQRLSDRLASITRRLWVAEILRAAAVVVPAGVLVDLGLRRGGLSPIAAGAIAFVIALATAGWWLVRRVGHCSSAAAAKAIEAARPGSRNVVVTAEELSRHPDRARSWIRARVLDQATDIATGAPVASVVPLSKSAILAVTATVVSIALSIGFSGRTLAAVRGALQPPSASVAKSSRAQLSIVATITPPAYLSQSARTLDNPDRIDALQGSHLHLAVGGGDGWQVRFSSDPIATTPTSEGVSVDLPLTRSGYLAIEPIDREAAQARRRLVPVTVTPDRAPTLRIEAPGKDLLLPDAKSTVAVSGSAIDDYGLRSLELRYTKATGSGEQFEFQEGTIPLDLVRSDPKAWKARAAMALATLALGPGDAIIYRFVGHDARPGDAGLAVSDTFFVEIAGPGQVALEGFELPPDRERYALSQQMIVLKLERLRAREKSLERSALEEEVAGLAAEQRAVRANFIFLMGGHVEDEEEEAAHSDEIQEGRLENTARKEIVTAIQHMSRAEQGLAAVNTGAALPPARAAVEALQRAFGRNRYFLRTLPVRSRVDPSRRLTGEMSEASDWKRELLLPPPDPRAVAARRVLERLIALSPAIQSTTVDTSVRSALTALAEEALAVDPSAEDWQAISKSLVQLRDGADASADQRAKRLTSVMSLVTAMVQRNALGATPRYRGNRVLRGAWAGEGRP
jgi:hypothetical protein